MIMMKLLFNHFSSPKHIIEMLKFYQQQFQNQSIILMMRILNGYEFTLSLVKVVLFLAYFLRVYLKR